MFKAWPQNCNMECSLEILGTPSSSVIYEGILTLGYLLPFVWDFSTAF